MPGPVFLRGREIVLRTRERADSEFVRDVVNHPEVRRYRLESGPQNAHAVEDAFENADEATLLVCAADGAHDADGGAAGGPAEEDPDRPVGHLDLGWTDETSGMAWLDVWFAPEVHGTDVAREGLALYLDHLFFERRLAKTAIVVADGDDALRDVVEPLGFTREARLRAELFVEGERRDADQYGLLREEWVDERGAWLGEAGAGPVDEWASDGG